MHPQRGFGEGWEGFAQAPSEISHFGQKMGYWGFAAAAARAHQEVKSLLGSSALAQLCFFSPFSRDAAFLRASQAPKSARSLVQTHQAVQIKLGGSAYPQPPAMFVGKAGREALPGPEAANPGN